LTIDEPTGTRFAPTYRSGTAARLAGIPVETLRVWERRYGVVGPGLSPRGHRLYATEDVSRLALIKQLVDLGSPIGSIATLPLASLREMRDSADAASRGGRARPAGSPQAVRVALVGETLTERAARDSAGVPTLDVVATAADTSGALTALRGISADVLAIELPTLQADSVAFVNEMVEAVGARSAVVSYRFGPTAVLSALRARGHAVTHSPLDLVELERLCREAIRLEPTHAPTVSPPVPLEAVPSRRFDDRSLAQIAQASTALYCECPRHVVDLLLSLGSFERYSAECENRSPADAALHRYLQRVAGSARALFEDALVLVARSEGLALPGGGGANALDPP
jgi:MerR family transcriptional regulator, light-induced transcriptional regulator